MNSVARRGRHAVFRYGRLVTWLASGVLIIVLSTYVALPIALSSYVPQLAARHGLRLHLEQVRIEPLKARLLFSGVRAETTEGLPIGWSGIEAQVDLAALLSGRFALGSLRLSNAKLFAGEPWAGGADAIPAAPAALLEKMGVGELVVDRAELVAISETLGHPVTIDRLRVEPLDDAFRPRGAAVQADVSIGEGRSTFHGRLAVNAADWTLDTEISASGVPLDGLPALDGFGGALRGRLDGSGPLRLVHSPATGASSLTVGGRWAIERLKVELPAGRSIEVERLGIEGIAAGSNTDVVSVAAATAERVEWQGFATAQGHGTAARLAVEELERHAGGELRFALASAEAIDGRGGSPDLRLRDVVLDSVALSPAGVAAAGMQVSDARLVGETGAFVLERLSVDGFERAAGGTVNAASKRARPTGPALPGEQGAASGPGAERAGASGSGQAPWAWKARRVRIGHVDVETGGTSYTLQRLALVDAMDDGERGSARIARVGALEHRFGGDRIVFEELVATSPAWSEEEGRSKAIEAASLTLHTADGRRWRSDGWSLGGAGTAAPALPEEGQEAFTSGTPPRGKAGASGHDFGGLVIRGIADTVREIAGALLKAG